MATTGALAAATAGAVAAAATGSGWGTVAAVAVAAAAELVPGRAGLPERWLELVQLPAGGRSALRWVALVLLAGRTASTAVLVGTAIAAVVVVGLSGVRRAALVAVDHLRRPPLLCRNLPLGLRVPRSPSLAVRCADAAAVADLVAAIGLAVAGRSTVWAAAGGLAAAVAVAAVPAVMLAAHAAALRRRRVRAEVVRATEHAVEQLAPEVILYFGGTPEEVYQPQMWLDPVARLGRSALVVLRDHAVLEQLPATALPVISAPYNGTLAGLSLPADVATLFVTHSGNNAAMLRRREARSVFVGHGDSDKPDSVNPVARVYEQVWVAGPLGRRRYAAARIGVPDERIVEIGRPQLQPPESQPSTLTVLYAPTWEGWGDDPHHSSLPHAGALLIRALLDRPDLRVIYRPHPLTGRRDPGLRRAHHAVVDLLRVAGATFLGGARRGTGTRGGDLLDQAVTTGSGTGGPEPGPADAGTLAHATGHVIVAPGGPSLASCFAQTSLLVADVSSVISDFLVADRPFATIDTRGVGAAAFRRRFPAVAGGFVLGLGADGLDDALAAARGEHDPTARARRRLIRQALGDPATAQQRFAAAVAATLRGAPTKL